jgi:hypothetical protein
LVELSNLKEKKMAIEFSLAAWTSPTEAVWDRSLLPVGTRILWE